MEKLTLIETWNLQVAKQVLREVIEWDGMSYRKEDYQRSVKDLFDIIERVTSPTELPCGGCGGCLDCLRIERRNAR